MLQHEIMRQDVANEPNKASRLWKARFPQGNFFDPSYHISLKEQLIQRQARETTTRVVRKGKSQSVGPPVVPYFVGTQAGPSRSDDVDIARCDA